MIVVRRALPVLRRLTAITIAIALVALCAAFPFAGTFLVREDALARADAIFVLEGARAERWMEAADVYTAGDAAVIALSPGRQEQAELVLRARGIRYPTNAMLARDALMQLGVPAAAILLPDRSVDNTAEEAQLLRRLAASHGWHRVIVITSKYHCRRTRFAFDRELRGTDVAILVHATRYDSSDPAHWWRHRADVRYVLSELEKLAAYKLGLGG